MLGRFYATECDYAEKTHFSVASPANRKKLAYYTALLNKHGINSGEMAVIGCGRGGFLQWLMREGWQGKCYGFDVDAKSLPSSDCEVENIWFLDGGAISLPFPDGALTLLTYFHVFEHINDLNLALTDAERTICQGAT